MADATCAGRKVDRAGSPMTVQAPAIDLPAPRSAAGDSTPGAAAPAAYTITARVLHWVTALVIALMIPLGGIIANDWIGGTLQNFIYSLHESLGALLIPVVLARFGHRLTHPPLPLPADISALQRFAAHMTHVGLYALLVAQPRQRREIARAAQMPGAVVLRMPASTRPIWFWPISATVSGRRMRVPSSSPPRRSARASVR